MALSPARRQGWSSVRALVGRRQLAWALGGAVAAAATAGSGIPGSGLWAIVVFWTFAAGAGRAGRRQDHQLKVAERLHTRPPMTADPALVPAPTRDGVVRRLRLVDVWMVVGALMAVALSAGCAWLTWTPPQDLGGKALPRWTYPILAVMVVVLLGLEMRGTWRTRQQLRGVDVDRLPRCRVTVLGFTGQHGVGVVFVPGKVDVPRALAASAAEDDSLELPSAGGFSSRMGCRLGLLIPGDVLVCDGHLMEGNVVALSTANRCDWTEALRVLPWSEVREPVKPQAQPSSTFRASGAAANHGRRVAVRRADGSVVLPGPDERGST